MTGAESSPEIWLGFWIGVVCTGSVWIMLPLLCDSLPKPVVKLEQKPDAKNPTDPKPARPLFDELEEALR